MYARLWWKELRQFWPIWVFLALAALGVQEFALRYGGRETHEGLLGAMAMGWACLYAVAVGAAAFAGEREAGTLRLLDIMPVSRPTVWSGKVSFGLVTSAALGLLLLALAAWKTDSWDARQFGVGPTVVAIGWGAIMLEALAWGLFWSAYASNALNAAVLASVCVGLSMATTSLHLDQSNLTDRLRFAAPWHLGAALALTFASSRMFTRTGRPPADRSQTGLHFRSPVTWVESPDEWAFVAGPEPSRRTPGASAWRLAWLTGRQGLATWALLVGIGLGIPSLAATMSGVFSPGFAMALNSMVALVAGVCVFNPESRDRTNRFLAHHGVRPWKVWAMKLGVWAFGLSLIWGSLVILAIVMPLSEQWRAGLTIGIAAIVLGSFAVGQLCGMLMRRGITAVVVALVALILVSLPLGALTSVQMMPEWGLLIPTLALLVVTWGWSGDWLHDRPGARRWVRLGLWLFGALAVLFGTYVGGRALGVPEIAPLPEPVAWVAASAPLSDDQNAATLYRQAVRQLLFTDEISQIPFGQAAPYLDVKSPEVARFLDLNPEALDLTRRASARSECRFLRKIFMGIELPAMNELARLVGIAARDRQAKGDLDGAWNDLLVLFRMARHRAVGGAIADGRLGLAIEQKALALAMSWAAAPGQTPERLRGAIAAYRALPPMPTALEVVRAEARVTEHTLDLPGKELRDLLNPSFAGSSRPPFLIDLMTSPWEVSRTRKVTRLYFDAEARLAAVEPWQRPLPAPETVRPTSGLPLDDAAGRPQSEPRSPASAFPEGVVSAEDLEAYLASTPLARYLIPNIKSYVTISDRNEVARRALVVMLGLRSWSLKHGDKFPETLSALATEDLTGIPMDPYTNEPFHYDRQSTRLARRRDGILVFSEEGAGKAVFPKPDQCLIFSAGPDRRPDEEVPTNTVFDDIVFLFPPTPDEPPDDVEKEDHGGMSASGMPGATSGGTPGPEN
jgi:ABC-type transport system involved in multi-copper enzyme maturation permease subunit